MEDWTKAKFEDFVEILDFRDHMKRDWSRYICGWPPVEFDGSGKETFLGSELKSSAAGLEAQSDLYCNIRTTISDPARAKRWKSSHDATMRLDQLNSGPDSPFQKESQVPESQEEEDSALDSVELLDLGDDVQDDESWLYESPKRRMFLEKPESALRWCRRVLEHRSPEMEAACRVLINVLDQRSNGFYGNRFYKCSVVLPQTGSAYVGRLNRNSNNTTCNTTCNTADSSGLRQDYVSTSATTSPRNSPTMLQPYFNTSIQKINADDFAAGIKTPSSPYWPPFQSLTSPTFSRQESCQSPKVTGLHHQVTQFKLLKLAQNKASSPGGSRSPLRTSLRSLQAVRNSRSLDTDDCRPDGQIISPPSGLSSARMVTDCWSSSLSAVATSSSDPSHSVRPPSMQTDAVKRLQRSQSLSPGRIPPPAKAYLPEHRYAFASPRRRL